MGKKLNIGNIPLQASEEARGQDLKEGKGKISWK
jgi:hypothetical protein